MQSFLHQMLQYNFWPSKLSKVETKVERIEVQIQKKQI